MNCFRQHALTILWDWNGQGAKDNALGSINKRPFISFKICQEVSKLCSMHTVVRLGNRCKGFHSHSLRRRVFIKYTKQVCVIFCWNFLPYRKYYLYQLNADQMLKNVTAFTDYRFRSATGSNYFLSTTF